MMMIQLSTYPINEFYLQTSYLWGKQNEPGEKRHTSGEEGEEEGRRKEKGGGGEGKRGWTVAERDGRQQLGRRGKRRGKKKR